MAKFCKLEKHPKKAFILVNEIKEGPRPESMIFSLTEPEGIRPDPNTESPIPDLNLYGNNSIDLLVLASSACLKITVELNRHVF